MMHVDHVLLLKALKSNLEFNVDALQLQLAEKSRADYGGKSDDAAAITGLSRRRLRRQLEREYQNSP